MPFRSPYVNAEDSTDSEMHYSDMQEVRVDGEGGGWENKEPECLFIKTLGCKRSIITLHTLLTCPAGQRCGPQP